MVLGTSLALAVEPAWAGEADFETEDPPATAVATQTAEIAGPHLLASVDQSDAPPETLLVPVPAPTGQNAEPVMAAGTPTVLYLNRTGGIYTPGNCMFDVEGCNDSSDNITSVPSAAAQLPAWDVEENEWSYVMTCVRDILGPFNVVVTDQDPGAARHIESYVGGNPSLLGLPSNVAGVSPFRDDCGVINDSIVFVFPQVVRNDLRRTCETIAQEFAHSIGLDHLYVCEDPMTYLSDCGDKTFQFRESLCGTNEVEPCRCGGTSQNSAKMLLDKLGRGDAPTLWLAEPSNNDVVNADGFKIKATVTKPPVSVEILVDGILVKTAIPDLSSGANYQSFEFGMDTNLRPGTHHIQVNARYGDSDQVVTALIKVEDGQGDELVGGCQAGSSTASSMGLLLVVGFLGLLGRRRSVAFLSLALWAGCQDTIEGGYTPSSTCELDAYNDLPQVGIIHSRSNGPCTATLIGPTAAITAAHCTVTQENEPLVILFRVEGTYRQYIARSVTRHPLFVAGSTESSGDIAIVRLNEAVPDSIDPIRLVPGEPTFGFRMSLIAYDEWKPLDRFDPVKRVLDTYVGDVSDNADTFAYNQAVSSSCMQARSGGLVLGSDAEGRQYVLGLQAHGRDVLRLDNYACWAACEPAAGLPASLIPSSCDCQAVGGERCGACGLSNGDACVNAEDLYPCSDGLACTDDGRCVVAACDSGCTDAGGNIVCEGDMGNRPCTGGQQACTCGPQGWENCGTCLQ